MKSLPEGYAAIVVGASGGIGGAIVARLSADPRCRLVHGLHRGAPIPLDFDDAPTIAEAAKHLGAEGPFHLLVNATGVLHRPAAGGTSARRPEKRLADLDDAWLADVLRINTIGPALLLRHFAPLLASERAVVALLSARVGSIADNRLGGWYGYRASKAALNMIVRTAAIELARTQPGTVVLAVHPGTVDTGLSRPFGGERIGRPPDEAAARILETIDGTTATDSGRFLAYDGTPVPW